MPLRFPALKSLDIFLWGYVKEKVYINKPHTLQQQKDNIHKLESYKLKNWVCDWKCFRKGTFVRDGNGRHLKDVILDK